MGLPTFVTAAITSGIAIAITYATARRNDIWAWVAVGVLTLASAVASVWLYLQQQGPDAAGVSGVAEVAIRRKSRIRAMRADASRHARVDVGPGSDLDTLEVTAGMQAPRAVPDDGRDAV
ncbi:MAG: hypothetical protein J2P25_21545 [Nocardiopsaceae bacterium]|nr:hypothetical protein [Nocardiopsaceae bacterium]